MEVLRSSLFSPLTDVAFNQNNFFFLSTPNRQTIQKFTISLLIITHTYDQFIRKSKMAVFSLLLRLLFLHKSSFFHSTFSNRRFFVNLSFSLVNENQRRRKMRRHLKTKTQTNAYTSTWKRNWRVHDLFVHVSNVTVACDARAFIVMEHLHICSAWNFFSSLFSNF